AERELVGFVGMAADEGDDFGFFAFGEGRKDLVDSQAAQSNDGPAKFFSGRVGDLLRGVRCGAVEDRARQVRGHDAASYTGQEAAAGEFFVDGIVGHGGAPSDLRCAFAESVLENQSMNATTRDTATKQGPVIVTRLELSGFCCGRSFREMIAARY